MPTLGVIALAKLQSSPVSPHLLPELSVQLACGLPTVAKVEYMPWLYPLFQAPPRLEHGRLIPPVGPGHGLSLDEEAVAKFAAR